MAQFIIGNTLGKIADRHQGLQKFLWRIDFVAVWLLVRVFGLLPVDAASSLGKHFGRLAGPRLKRKTAMYRENLSRAFPEKSPVEIEQLICEGWGSAGRVMAEYTHFKAIFASRNRERLHVEMSGGLAAHRQATPPAIYVGAHLNNWEMLITALNRLNIPSVALYTPPTNPLLAGLLYEYRRDMDCALVSRDRAAREIIRHLEQGRSVGLIVDRRLDAGPEVPFFDIPKPSSMLPARLALKLGLDLVPTRVERLRGAEFRVTFYSPVVATDPRADKNRQAQDMMGQVHQHFQHWISEAPGAWFCPQRIWPKTALRRSAGQADAEVDANAA